MPSTPESPATERHIPDEQLELFLMDELAPAEHAQLLSHLDLCPDCAKRLQNAAQFQDLLISAVADLPPPPPLLRERLRALLDQLTTPRWALAGGLAAAATAALLSVPAKPPPYGSPELQGMASVRGDDPAHPNAGQRVFSPTGRLSLRVRPELSAEKAVVIYAELERAGGGQWSLPTTDAKENGAISVDYELSGLDLPAGDYTLTVEACTPPPLFASLRLACRELSQSFAIEEKIPSP